MTAFTQDPVGTAPRGDGGVLPRGSRITGAPAGTPYHRLARTARHRWWRPPAAMLTSVAGCLLLTIPVVFGTAAAAGLAGVKVDLDSLTFSDPLWETAVTLLLIAVMIPAVLLAARLVQRRPAGTVSSVTGRLRWRWLLVCTAVAVAAVLLLFGLDAAFTAVSGVTESDWSGGEWAGWPAFLTAVAVIVPLVLFQTAAEEYFFRGWIVQFFGSYLRSPWIGVVVGALLFALAHGLGTPWGFADLVVFGLVLGWLVIRTGGLEAAIAYHAVNNLVVFVASAAFAGGLGETVGSSAAEASWTLPAAEAIVLPLYAWVVVRLARRFRVARTAPGPADPPAEPAVPAD